MRKVSARLVPFLIVCYFVAYLDRVNVGFAASQYALGAGIFFWAYFFFEVPSNLFLERFGARKWIARIMFSWGIISGMMAVIVGPYSYYLVRVLLGIAEAGFFPGIIFYLTLWFPAQYRARIVGLFMAAIPLSSVIGAPISGLIMAQMDGLGGLKGWQWLYIVEAAPAVILSVVTFYYLTDRPADAAWLQPEERTWLANRLEAERRQREAVVNHSVMEALLNPKVLLLGLVYFGAVACNYGLGFFLPQIIRDFGLSVTQTGFVAAIPYALGAVAMVLWSRHSDAKRERKGHAAAALACAAFGLAGAAMTSDPVLKMAFICVGSLGTFAVLPVFWTLPTSFLSGAAAAGGIAAINSIGNLSGYFGPAAMGWARTLRAASPAACGSSPGWPSSRW